MKQENVSGPISVTHSDAVLAREDGALGAVGVVEHAEYDGGERVEGGGVVWRRHQPREVVLQGLTQHGVKGQIWPENIDRFI